MVSNSLFLLFSLLFKEIGGRKIKVNVTEKPLQGTDISLLQAEESQFVDSPHKVYVGNLAKTVTTEVLKDFFSEKGTVLSAKVQRTPGTSKSSGYGFVSFSSDEEVEAAIEALNNAVSRFSTMQSNVIFLEFVNLLNPMA